MKFSEDVEQILDRYAASGPGSLRPTRKQIIEEAVRYWDAKFTGREAYVQEIEAHRQVRPLRPSALLRGDGCE